MLASGGRGPGQQRANGEIELRACVEKTAGDDLTALENELRFCVHEEGADLDHPGGGGQADARAPGFTDRAQEVAIGKRMRGGEIDGSGNVLCSDEEFDGADEVGVVDPGDELVAGADGTTEAVANETEEDIEDSASVWAEGHGAAQGDLAGSRSGH